MKKGISWTWRDILTRNRIHAKETYPNATRKCIRMPPGTYVSQIAILELCRAAKRIVNHAGGNELNCSCSALNLMR